MIDHVGLFGNIVIRGKVKAITGMHIGASADTVEIGGIDSPVIKHPISGEPFIPGSSLKGKMRSFMERIQKAKSKDFHFNRNSGSGRNEIWQHVCDDIDKSYIPSKNNISGPGARTCPVCRVYGATGSKTGGKNHPARIIVRDCKLSNKTEMEDDNLLIFEAKMENAIDRITAAAHPRTFERVPADAKFAFEIVYKVQGSIEGGSQGYNMSNGDLTCMKEDVKNIFEVLSLIEKDGLGGNISRGYGQVEFTLEGEKCIYYKVGGQSELFLPVQDNNTPIIDLELLRQNNFANLDNIISTRVVDKTLEPGKVEA